MSKYRNAYFILFSLKLGQNSANPNTKLLVWLDYLNQGSVESGEHPKVYHRGRQALAHQACPPLRARRRGQGRRQQARRYVRADPRPSRVQDPQAHGRVQEPASWVQERAQVSVEDGRGLPHDPMSGFGTGVHHVSAPPRSVVRAAVSYRSLPCSLVHLARFC